MTIPATLLGGPYVTLIDGSAATPTQTSNATHTSLYFTYTQATHKVEIIGATVIPEFSSTMVTATLMIATATITIFLKKKIHWITSA